MIEPFGDDKNKRNVFSFFNDKDETLCKKPLPL